MISQKYVFPNKTKKTMTIEDSLHLSELKLEAAKFEFNRLQMLSNRKSFTKKINDSPEKLLKMSRRLHTAQMKIDQYQDLIMDIKAKMKELEEKKAAEEEKK